MPPNAPSTIDDLQKLNTESPETIDRALQQIDTIERLLDLLSKLAMAKKMPISPHLLNAMHKRLSELEHAAAQDMSIDLRIRINHAFAKILELQISSPDVVDMIIESPEIGERLYYIDDHITHIEFAYSLLTLHPHQASIAKMATFEDRLALARILNNYKIQWLPCTEFMHSVSGESSPFFKPGTPEARALHFFSLVLKEHQEILRKRRGDDNYATIEVGTYLKELHPLLRLSYEISHKASRKKGEKDKLTKDLLRFFRENSLTCYPCQELIAALYRKTDWPFISNDLIDEAEKAKKEFIKKELFPSPKEKTRWYWLTPLLELYTVGMLVTLFQEMRYHFLKKQFMEFGHFVERTSNGEILTKEERDRYEKLQKKLENALRLDPDIIQAMAKSDAFYQNVILDPTTFPGFKEEFEGPGVEEKKGLQKFFRNFIDSQKVIPFTLRFHKSSKYAKFGETVRHLQKMSNLLRHFEYPDRIDTEDIVSILSDSSVKVDMETGEIDLGNGEKITPKRKRRLRGR